MTSATHSTARLYAFAGGRCGPIIHSLGFRVPARQGVNLRRVEI